MRPLANNGESTPPRQLGVAGVEHPTRWGHFEEPEWEARYRQEQLKTEVHRTRLTFGWVIVALILMMPNDYLFFGLGAEFWSIFAGRVTVIAWTIWLWRRLCAATAPAEFDRWMMIWSVSIVIFLLVVTATRPPNYPGHAVINVISVLMIYVVTPLSIRGQAFTGGLLSLGIVALGTWVNPWSSEAMTLVVMVSLLGANGLGIAMSRELQIWKRRQYAALQEEMQLRKNLETALGEIRTLRGILPICSHCKKVWNDAGFWEQVEDYVREHTHAEFSHSICPECLREQYPEINWEEANRVRREREARLAAGGASGGADAGTGAG